MHVPFLDLPAQNRSIWDELQRALQPVLAESQFVLGPAVERFETAFAGYVGVRYCVGVNNGTSALHLALLACDVGAGDEVITTPHTWISTSWAIDYVQARPIFVDIDPDTYNLNVAQVESAITSRTKAILPVHLYGRACDLDALVDIAGRRNLTVIEDAAQAHGARWGDRRVGAHGRVGCFSFYPGKNLGSFGEAGAVVTNDGQIERRVRALRDHAQQGRHHHVETGYNARMEGIQGAVLEVKLRHLDRWNAARAQLARRYAGLLADVPGLQLPASAEREQHVWHLYVVQVASLDRDRLRSRLDEAGIATGVHYPTPVHLQPAFSSLGHRPGDFPVAEKVAARCLSLPLFPELTTAQQDHVAAVLREHIKVAAA